MKYWKLLLLLLYGPLLDAQSISDSLLQRKVSQLPSVLIVNARIDGIKNEQFRFNKYVVDNLNTSISTDLQQSTLVNVRSYGASQLSTISVRGLGAQHVATVWNGFNLTNAMNGTAEVSLMMPFSLLATNAFAYGSSNQMGASNNVAGSIQQQYASEYLSGLEMRMVFSHGSFHANQQYVGIKNGRAKSCFGFDFFHEYSLNDFDYKSSPSTPANDRKNKHSALDNYNCNLVFQKKISKKILLHSAVNYVRAYREIAPAIFEANSDAIQKDQQVKSYVNLQYSAKKLTIRWNNAYAFDRLDYQKKSADIQSLSNLHKAINRLEFDYVYSLKHRLVFAIENDFSLAKSAKFVPSNNRATQNISSVRVQYSFLSKKWNASLGLKQQVIQAKITPFLLDIYIDYRPIQYVSFSAKAARIYRQATLNDLYWSEGGNRNLLPEKGWTIEYSLFVKAERRYFYFDTKVTNFYYWINNWIQWTPTASGYWTPKNTKKVFSRGVELQSELRYERNSKSLILKAGYSYTLPTQISDGEQYGKQLIYESRHKTFLSLLINAYHFSFSYTFQYTGKRYTSSDNTYSLAPFATSSLRFAYSMSKNSIELSPYLAVMNLSNASYQTMAGRAMAGRSFMGGIIFTLHQKPLRSND